MGGFLGLFVWRKLSAKWAAEVATRQAAPGPRAPGTPGGTCWGGGGGRGKASLQHLGWVLPASVEVPLFLWFFV